MKYKFEQFTEAIEAKEININFNNIIVDIMNNNFNVDVVFPETEQAVYFTFDICEMTKENIEKLVNEKLKEFEV